MEVLRNGKFSLPILTTTLSKGLRKIESNPVNVHSLITCEGVVGKEGVLSRIQALVKSYDLDTAFPYPQIFVETNIIVVCTATEIYEAQGDILVLRLTVTEGTTWSLISVHDFIYMSNGAVAVTRDPLTKEFALSTDLPTATAICNYNGQVIIGGPDAGYYLGD